VLGATPDRLRPDAPPPPLPMAGEMAVAVMGAHMSGLPLNGQLTSRGGRFLEATTTAPEYRLYALPGGPPQRPGLLRTSPGAAIAVEVWALPMVEVGSFLAGIPSPLSLGQVRLADGRLVTGFLVEAAAVEGAEDVTGFCAWRAYLAARG
jgi:allophanate hydrolase